MYRYVPFNASNGPPFWWKDNSETYRDVPSTRKFLGLGLARSSALFHWGCRRSSTLGPLAQLASIPPFLPRFEFRHISPAHRCGDIRNSNRSSLYLHFHRPRCTANQAPAACTAATLMGAATVAAAMATVAAAPLLPELALSPELPRSGCRIVFRPALVPSRGP